MFGFIITRHVNSEKTNRYWIECVHQIRLFYPQNPVVIIDDHSDPKYVSKMPFPNCTVIKSEFPKRGELLPYYYFYRYKFFPKAVILHDSVFLQQRIQFENADNMPLWHFTHPLHQNVELEDRLLRCLDNNEKLLELHSTHAFRGAFGCMSVVTLDFVTRIEEKYKLCNLLSYVNSRLLRMGLERVFGLIFTVENPERVSMFGTIHDYCRWGLTFLEYLQQKKSDRKAVVKVWSGR